MDDFLSKSVEDTEAFAEELSKKLEGDESPTFAIVNEYVGDYPLYHFDMYRIESWNDLDSIGFFDYIGNGVMIIEWSENIEGALPDDVIRVTINKTNDENERIISIEGM